jgi:hypothetical protein
MTSVHIGAHAPKLGENNEDIDCKLLGFNQEKLAQLKWRGII